MSRWSRVFRIILLLFAVVALDGCANNVALLSPAGPISAQEKSLILLSFWIMLAVAVPVFVMTFWFAWKYRASNTEANYQPNWDFSWTIDIIVWALPIIIVIALSFISWNTTHDLAPYKPLVSDAEPVDVEVVALDWKWLFIYPKQHIATVNQLVLPVNRPVNFKITSDTVMTSFFIPKLGTQIYAMAGMRTRLNLLADKLGTYTGANFQFSGEGYSDMKFAVKVKNESDYQSWLQKVKTSQQALDVSTLTMLEKPTQNAPVSYYSSVADDLFNTILKKYRSGIMCDGLSL